MALRFASADAVADIQVLFWAIVASRTNKGPYLSAYHRHAHPGYLREGWMGSFTETTKEEETVVI